MQRRVRFACTGIIAVSALILLLAISTAHHNRAITGEPMGADFPAFYTAGTILNEFGGDRLYDTDLQARILHRRLLPDEPSQMILPFVNAPFMALPFAALSHLTYPAAFIAWTVISALLYAAGLALLLSSCRSLSASFKRDAILAAMAFEPFVIECTHGGQISTFGFFFISLAIWLGKKQSEAQQRSPSSPNAFGFAQGLAIAACIYKPTLMPWMIVMLLFTRRWSSILGLLVGITALALFSIATIGATGSASYGHVLLTYAHSAIGTGMQFQTTKFVDANSFLRLFTPTGFPTWAIVAIIAACWVPRLSQAWKIRDPWPTTLAATIVLNLYVGIYDTILLVPAFLITADQFARTSNNKKLPRAYWVIAAIVFFLPWTTPAFAKIAGFQLFTIAGIAALFYFSRVKPYDLQADSDSGGTKIAPNRRSHAGENVQPV